MAEVLIEDSQQRPTSRARTEDASKASEGTLADEAFEVIVELFGGGDLAVRKHFFK